MAEETVDLFLLNCVNKEQPGIAFEEPTTALMHLHLFRSVRKAAPYV